MDSRWIFGGRPVNNLWITATTVGAVWRGRRDVARVRRWGTRPRAALEVEGAAAPRTALAHGADEHDPEWQFARGIFGSARRADLRLHLYGVPPTLQGGR